MRIPKKFGERTEVEREIAKKYYLVYEGTQTEVQYFNGIIDNKERLKINLLLEICAIIGLPNSSFSKVKYKLKNCSTILISSALVVRSVTRSSPT